MANIVSPNVNYLLSKIVANSIKGCFYGFVNYKDIEDIMEELEQEEHISIIKKGSICLCEVDPNYLVNNANTLQPDTYTKEDLDLIKKRMADAIVEFEKFLIARGKEKENFAGTIGIYCTNLNPHMIFNGMNYPAFRLSMVKVLHLLQEYGYCVKLGNEYLEVSDAIKDTNKLWSGVKISPTLTGIFMNIKCNISIVEMEEKERNFKKKYDLN